MRNLTEVQTAQNELILNETWSGDIKALFMRRDVENIQVTTDMWAFHLDLKFDSEKNAYVMNNTRRVGEKKHNEEMDGSPDMNTGCRFNLVAEFGMKNVVVYDDDREWKSTIKMVEYDCVTAVIVTFEDGRRKFINKNFVWSEFKNMMS